LSKFQARISDLEARLCLWTRNISPCLTAFIGTITTSASKSSRVDNVLEAGCVSETRGLQLGLFC